jgi:hypothetical protein
MKARSPLYTEDIADRILRELRSGRSLHDICRDDDLPHRDTVTNWVRHDHEGFAARYRQACQVGHACAGHLGYPPETVERFLGELMRGRSLVEVCGDPDMPDHTTVNRWVVRDRDGFAARYRSAREIGHLRNAAVHYTPEIADRILDELMSGRPLDVICEAPDMPAASSVRRWITEDREGFAARYWQAREIGCHAIADQTLPIVDDRRNDWIVQQREDGTIEKILDPERVNRARLRIKARHWLVAKLLPKKFGDRPERTAPVNNDGDVAEMMKLLDGRTRGLPSEDEPLDEE